jgi:hypothetical protein
MRPNRLHCGNIAFSTGISRPHSAFLVKPRHVLAKPKNQMLEVDAAEEAKQVALYRYELTGELYDDDEILNFFYNDITELEQEERDEITFECWLEEMISFTKSDDTLTGSARQRWPKCGTGQSDRAMSGSRWAGAVRRPRGFLAPKSRLANRLSPLRFILARWPRRSEHYPEGCDS